MATYNSQYTGEQIDAAVAFGKSPDVAPTASSTKGVTSGGVKAYVDEAVSDVITQFELGLVTPALKSALLQLASKVAYIDGDGQNYYNDLYAALYYRMWPVTNTLSHCSTSNASSQTLKDGPYTATITPASNYTLTGATVSITMGGVDITSTAYSNGVISIPAVTGALVISVTAVYAGQDPLALLTFEAYPWAASLNQTYRNYVYKINNASARARCTVPFDNSAHYTFSIVDTSKYNIAVYGITSLETITTTAAGQTVDAYPGEDNAVSWGTGGSRTTPYVAISFKKLDNTEFTAEELANMYGTVFTATRS